MAAELRFDTWQDRNGNARKCIINHAYFEWKPGNDNYTSLAAGSPGTVYDTPVTITYTPLRANSILYLYGCIHIRMISAFGSLGGIKRDGTKLPGNFREGSMDFFYKGSEVNHHRNLEFRTNVNANSTAATTFTCWVASWQGTAEFNNGWGQNFIQVWEVAQ